MAKEREDPRGSRYWPGPLTLVVDADPALVARLGAKRGVGLRVPDDALCCALLARTGPLAVTSANAHGAAPATTAAGCSRSLDGVAAVLDGGSARRRRLDGAGPDRAVAFAVVREGAVPRRSSSALLSGG